MKEKYLNICLIIFFICSLGLYPIQKIFDQKIGANRFIEDNLYVSSGNTIKRLSIGFESFVADIYWVRTVQYFGRKLFNGLNEDISLSHLNNRDMRLLAPLLKIVTTLDPQYMLAYSYGANFLAEYDTIAAIELLNKGIEVLKLEVNNYPEKVVLKSNLNRLYMQLGYIYWRFGKYEEASKVYEEGSRIPGAPSWMKLLAGAMKTQSKDRGVAYSIFELQLAESEDKATQLSADYRLRHLKSLDERDFLNHLLENYKIEHGSCPNTLKQIIPLIKKNIDQAKDSRGKPLEFRVNSSGVILDPGENPTPYVINQNTCKVELGDTSSIPKTWDPK